MQLGFAIAILDDAKFGSPRLGYEITTFSFGDRKHDYVRVR